MGDTLSRLESLECDQINERCRIGRNAKKENGGFISGTPPYGYDVVGGRQVGSKVVGGKLTLNPKEQAVLESIRKQCRGGKTTYPTKTGAKWSHVLVGKLLER